MAKMKLNIDWKAFFLGHGEKLVVGLVSLLVVVLVWQAIQREGMPAGQEPEDISSRTQQATQTIENTDPDEAPIPEVEPLGEGVIRPISLYGYVSSSRINPDVFEQRPLRGDPAMLAVSDLELSTGFGPFAVPDQGGVGGGREMIEPRLERPGLGGGAARPNLRGIRGGGGGGLLEGAEEFPNPLENGGRGLGAGLAQQRTRPLPPWFQMGGNAMRGARVEGRRWVVVNGLVPIKKQHDEYEKVFREAEGFDAARDFPDYLGAIVYRADVTNLPAGQEPQWQSIFTMQPKTMGEVHSQLARQGGLENDLVEPQFKHDMLTFPLGPLMMTSWGDDAKHSKIPRAPTPQELAERERQAAQPVGVEPEEEKKPEDDFLGGGGGFGGEGARRVGGRRAVGRVNMAEGEMPIAMQRGARMGGEGIIGAGQPGEEEVENLMFRYFDFDVRPGHRYRYRVTLVIRDPNNPDPNNPAALPKKFLDLAVAERVAKSKGYLMVPMAEGQASEAISVPFDGDVFAGEIKAAPPGSFYSEAEATVLVKEFDEQSGRTIAAKRQMHRGSVTIFSQDIWVPDPAQQQLVFIEGQEFKSEFVLLDLFGGDRIDEPGGESRGGRPPMLNTLTKPAEMLFLDSAGNLIVRREMEDLNEIALHDELVKVDEAAPGGGGLVPGRGGEEEMMFEGEGGVLFEGEGGPPRRTQSPRRRTTGSER
ncbi:MAG: hypothetical protein KDA42_06465 [Planctomycetales bacterium]|nr:hypothetical protein [Planctomycetales bacterium]